MHDPDTSPSAPELVEHFFRHESGRLTATLTRRFGAWRLDMIEDAIQFALERALGTWARRGAPDNPAAWLTRVATNHLIDQLRRAQRDDLAEEVEGGQVAGLDTGEDVLVMLFACADDRLAPRARLILCLKLLCGFSTQEITVRLFMTPANVQKTLERGRERLKQVWERLDQAPASDEGAEERLGTVQRVLYLLFNEGYSLGDGDVGLRVELCEEAIRLTRILVQHPLGDHPSTWALIALMHLNAARLPARLDAQGLFVPLQEQDRALWDRQHLKLGLQSIQHATRGDVFSRYHGEAAVQLEHALAPDFASTRWGEIAALYAALDAMEPSPLYVLNRAIALAEASGPAEGIEALRQRDLPIWFQRHHLYQGALGELYRRLARWPEAREHLTRALSTAPSRAERLLFQRRLASVQEP